VAGIVESYVYTLMHIGWYGRAAAAGNKYAKERQ
jgi:hypothetical protein